MSGIKERIIKEAVRLFYEEGIKTVRMDDIAAACGISKRTLYENFADREELIRQSLKRHIELHQLALEERLAKAGNAIDEFWIIFSYGTEFRPGSVIVMKDLIKFYPDVFNDFLGTHHCKLIEDNRQRFERGQKEGLILKTIDTEFMSRNLTNYLYGMRKGFELAEPDPWNSITPDSPRSFQFVIMMFLRGITTRKGMEYIDTTIFGGLE